MGMARCGLCCRAAVHMLHVDGAWSPSWEMCMWCEAGNEALDRQACVFACTQWRETVHAEQLQLDRAEQKVGMCLCAQAAGVSHSGRWLAQVEHVSEHILMSVGV